MSAASSSDLFVPLPVFDALPAPYLLLTPNWIIEAVSDAYLAATLTQRANLLGRPLFEAFPDNPNTPEAQSTHNLRQSLEQVLATRQPHEMARQHYDVPDPDRPGRFVERHWLPRNTPVLDAQGRVTHIIHAVVNVTDQLRAETQLRESQAREHAAYAAIEDQRQQLYQVFQAAPAMICVFEGPQHVFQFVNPSYQALVGSRPLVGRAIAEAMPELAGQPFFELLDGVYRTGETYQASEMMVQLDHNNSGVLETRYHNSVYQALHNAAGDISGIFSFAYDVTTQVQAREQVQELNEELAAINEEMQVTNEELGHTNYQLTRTNVDLDNFIYTASHDLKQPIANIEGLLLALTHQLPAEVHQEALVLPILERMHGAVERFKKTIGDLTEVSKLQQAHAQPARAVLLRPAIQEVALDLDPVLLAAEGELELEVPPSQVVTFSEKNLRSVVYNLLSNAIKYRSPDRPLQVRISSQLVAGRIELRVQDNGLGLDAAQQARLFGLFQRLHTHVEGTGIGLYMVKKIVENTGGTIAVQSELGVGSVFTVSLPT